MDMLELLRDIVGVGVTLLLITLLFKVDGKVRSAGLTLNAKEAKSYRAYKWLAVVLFVIALITSVLGYANRADAATRPAVQCSTHGYYSKAKKVTTVTVKTNRPTSAKKFDYRLQTYDKRGNIAAIWVKNQGMKITVKGNYFGGYAYQGVDQCAPFGVGVA